MDARETVHRWFELWNAHDLEGALGCLANDVILEQAEVADAPLHGREAVGRLVQDLYDAFPDGRLEVRTLVVEDPQVVAEYVFRGTQAGEYHGMAGANQAVENPIVDVMEVADGQIRQIRRYDRRTAKVTAPPTTEAG
jgi:steroid delta-isomerase-like uncharacterized protein